MTNRAHLILGRKKETGSAAAAENRDFPQIPIFRPPKHLHVEPHLRAIHDANRASQHLRHAPLMLTSPSNRSVEAAAAAPPLLHRRPPPGLLRPPNRHHSTNGELLVISPHFSDLIPPSFGRRNDVDEPKGTSSSIQGPACEVFKSSEEGALADGTYNLVPVNEEEVPEGGADVIVIDPESDTGVAQEGKPRSIT
nr:unnamed protein product [Digitaria exilis]